ncbi:DNA cytosine methyltransferase [Pseudofrankia inefficax]|uniref:DNA (cytosine-5-)-methyltransferase n=1 Tax=Pseudofrankia inefficax (strain DSM 45817 / CECT 9037 / DDB 130130 / EuI1c) TaxID=298654 RepID=E3IX49_PSEI1|nr:DNA cytosine methyltransferase [Pseudofrankia inefficax]ADP83821.1 C-5 cytosine-specific DNA methylase [Pseudofrankia inefficax]
MSGRDVTALDLFCGAGGSSTGLVGAGVRVTHAANHWPLAVEVHGLNHPETEHDCADISGTDPRRYPSTDILWASPECTNQSVAKGRRRPTGQIALFGDKPDPAAERSRATMWDVPRFAETAVHRGRPYAAIITENVVDVRWWLGWNGWILAMTDLGYDHAVVYLNSAFAHGKDYAGAPQYRDRLYIVFWRRGLPAPDLDIRPPAWCPSCATAVDAVQAWKNPATRWGRWRAQYVYQCPTCRTVAEPLAIPAAAVIDWANLGPAIGDRARPLAAATRERIRAGLARYGRPIGLPTGGNTFERQPGTRVWPLDVPRPVVTATGEAHALTVPPLLVPAGGTWNDDATPATLPIRVRTTRETEALASPAGAAPFIATLRRHVQPTGVAGPLATVTAAGTHHGLTTPAGLAVPVEARSGLRARLTGGPLRTQTTRRETALATPADGALLLPYYGTGVARPASWPAGTLTTRDRYALTTRTPADVPDHEIDGCRFRMLTVGEIGAAMAFPTDYLMAGATRRDQVRMYGNAVTPPAARLLAERVVAILEVAA